MNNIFFHKIKKDLKLAGFFRGKVYHKRTNIITKKLNVGAKRPPKLTVHLSPDTSSIWLQVKYVKIIEKLIADSSKFVPFYIF